MKPLAIDLFCGLGGWAEGFLSEGFDVIGFDIERHDYGTGGYPGQLVIQDVLTLHGAQFKDAAVIVASPPCQAYSYRAMPWKRAKALPPPSNELFDACFRIQREAIQATGTRCAECGGSGVCQRRVAYSDVIDEVCTACDGFGFVGCRQIPLVVESVRGAQKWVGSAGWSFGSYYLWGDIPALMPIPRAALKWGDCNGKRFDERPKNNVAAHREGTKVKGVRFDGSGRYFQSESVKVCSTDGGRRTDPGKGARFTSRDCGIEGLKVPGIKLSEVGFNVAAARAIDQANKPAGFRQTADMKRQHIGYSRKAASAQIAKIPFRLAQYIARCYKPDTQERVA